MEKREAKWEEDWAAPGGRRGTACPRQEGTKLVTACPLQEGEKLVEGGPEGAGLGWSDVPSGAGVRRVNPAGTTAGTAAILVMAGAPGHRRARDHPPLPRGNLRGSLKRLGLGHLLSDLRRTWSAGRPRSSKLSGPAELTRSEVMVVEGVVAR